MRQYNDANDNDANDVIKELSDSLSKQFRKINGRKWIYFLFSSTDVLQMS